MIAVFILAVVLIFLYDGLPLLKRKLWRELGVMGILIGSATYLGITEILGMTTPVHWLEQLLGPIGEIIFK